MNNPMEEGDRRTLDVMKEPSMKSPISVIEGEETTDKSKASCVDPLVNEPKRIKLEHSGPEAGIQIEQPGPQTGSQLEQPAPGASLGTKLEQPGSSKIEQPAPVATPGIKLEHSGPEAGSQIENTCIFALKLESDIAVVADGRVSRKSNVGTVLESFEVLNDEKIKIVLTEECLITMSGDEDGCRIIADKMKEELGRGALLSDIKDKFEKECVTRGALIGLNGRDRMGVHMILIGDEKYITKPTNVMLGNSNVIISVQGSGSTKAVKHFMKLRHRYQDIQLDLEKLILICQECVVASCTSKKTCGGLISTGTLLNGKASLQSQPRSVLDFVTSFYKELTGYFRTSLLFVTSKIPREDIDEPALKAYLKSQFLGMKSSKIIYMNNDPNVHMVVRKIQFQSLQAAYTVFHTFKREKLFPGSQGIHRCDDVMFGKLETDLARHSLFYFENILGRR